MFNSNEEVYRFVKHLAQQARNHGDDGAAEKLEGALRAGTTPSDQLGGAKAALKEVYPLFEEEKYPDELSDGIRIALEQIDQAFRRSNRRF